MDCALLQCRSALGDRSDVLYVSGELDVSTAPALEHTIARCLDGQGGEFRLDLSGLTFMDSGGAKALLHAHNRVESLGRRLVIVSPTSPVRKILDDMGLDQVIDIRDGGRTRTASV